MPTAAVQYTLVGFRRDLDWRPLSFMKTIPTNMVCSACGLVRKRTALLSCMHVLCDSCYEQCHQEGSHVCPLDGHEWHEEDDVEWRDLPPDELLRREVKCWNADQGCQHVAAASMITHHFQRECVHHSTCCPKCSVSVLCSEVCAHLRSGTCGPSSESRRDRDLMDENASFAAFRQTFEKKADEIETIPAGISTHEERLNDMSHDINALKENIREELATAVLNPENLKETLCEHSALNGEMKECLSTRSDAVIHLSAWMDRLEKLLTVQLDNVAKETADNLSKIRAAFEQSRTQDREKDQNTLECIANVHTLARLQDTRCEFFVEGVKCLQDKALKEGSALYYNQRVYLRGYCISPGLHFVKEGDSVTVHVLLQLHKGGMDDVVLCPFEQLIKLTVVHPDENGERMDEVKSSRSWNECQKPETSSNRSVYFGAPSFYLADLLNDGFVEDDKIRVKWELMP